MRFRGSGGVGTVTLLDRLAHLVRHDQDLGHPGRLMDRFTGRLQRRHQAQDAIDGVVMPAPFTPPLITLAASARWMVKSVARGRNARCGCLMCPRFAPGYCARRTWMTAAFRSWPGGSVWGAGRG